MVDREIIAATEQQWHLAKTRMKQVGTQAAVMAVVLVIAVGLAISYLAYHVADGVARYLVTTALMLGTAIPLTAAVWWRVDRQQRLSNRLMRALSTQLHSALDEVELESGRRHAQVRRQDFERQLASALEMAESEPEVVGVIEAALTLIAPAAASELLLADNSHAHLLRVAVASPDGQAPGCPVDSPDHCPAARRSQLQRFSDSDALDACPKLRHRAQGRCSAVCVPVSIMGRTVGVLHTIGPVGAETEPSREQDLTTLADQVGSRIGLIRVIAESQLQASTDSLTGLLNRRSMQNRVRELRRTASLVAVVVADLDNFKHLNDTFGHETGDRALRLFATTLSNSLRREDLVSRHGGEEFVMVLPGCSGPQANVALQSVREKLRSAAVEHGLPEFTCSFGVAQAESDEEFTDVIARADLALFEAKRAGRDRTVLYDGARDAVQPMALSVAQPTGDPASSYTVGSR